MNNIEKRLDKINEDLSITISDKLKIQEYESICGYCGENKKDIKTRHQNTQYVDEDSNYVECCSDCFKEIEEYWKEQWAEYWYDKL